ncbi:hypothetical protein [Conexibacter woesei]|uniref:Uncharacterized protein n=1 Tax=Conexibacter woesei (strain DSM 14684 / CCUG 47730 / CIP 108061 / JCM 11494 / NBRC 100937 / ID131577) TaxID=469383 RepID=D3FEN7_CONWI|nr:hypothetical protein [Conexibacter woesei]ADB49711.1 hypothetical protein Cwoe_1282 [Conexibacter woesei DSM 14684]
MMALAVLALFALVAVVVATWRSGGAPAPRWAARTTPRPRRSVGPTVYRVAQLLGFRHSRSRDALVLSVAQGRYGPVLRLRDDGAGTANGIVARAVRAPSPTRPPARPVPRPVPVALDAAPLPSPALVAPSPTRRIVDVAVLPLPPLPGAKELWQLTAVDVETRFVWADVARASASGEPAPERATRFVRRVADELEARGLRLDAIVVRPGSTGRHPLFHDGAADGVRLLRIVPGPRRGRIAARMHARAVAGYWRPALGAGDRRPLPTLRRGLQTWAEEYNDAAPANAADGRPAPAEALRALAADPRHSDS